MQAGTQVVVADAIWSGSHYQLIVFAMQKLELKSLILAQIERWRHA
jgi:hypothetical protein